MRRDLKKISREHDMHGLNDVDVVVCGGGATGLFLAKVLCEYGLPIALIERDPKIAPAASIRNEGWLHSGAFHAAAIENRDEAISVARRTRFGCDVIQRFAPEAIEDVDSRSYALIPNDRVSDVLGRWNDAGVSYGSVERTQVLGPLNRSLLKSRTLFEVKDVSINTRMLYAKLAHYASRLGAKILLEHEIVEFADNNTAVVKQTGGQATERTTIRAKLFLYAIGAQSKDFFRRNFNCDLPIGLSVSHLLDIAPKVCEQGFFMIEKDKATLMHHLCGSIVGLAKEQTIIDSPIASVIPEKAQIIKESAAELIPEILKGRQWNCRACVKVFRQKENRHAGLLPSFDEPAKNHVWVLPGKMTEAPFVAAEVFKNVVWKKLELADSVQRRPLDLLVESRKAVGWR